MSKFYIDNYEYPKFVSVVALCIGLYDLLRGYMHTFELYNSGLNIAKLNLDGPDSRDTLQLLGAFGISNYLTGVFMLLMVWKAKPLALMMLGFIPVIYGIGGVVMKQQIQKIPHPSKAAWGGHPLMKIYLLICTATFIFGVLLAKPKDRKTK
jgi:hypothetical protein